MNNALKAALLAFFLGVAGDALLRAVPWGVNVLLWTVLFLGVVWHLGRRVRPIPSAVFAFAAVGALAAAAGIAVRASGVLVTLDILLLLTFFGVLALPARGVMPWATGTMRVIAAVILTALQCVAGVFSLAFLDIPWRDLNTGTGARRTLLVARGIAIALPALLLFGALLASADVAFAALLREVFAVDFPTIAGHVLLTGFVTVCCAGFLRSLLWSGELSTFSRPGFLHLGAAETNIAVGLIDVLFAAFVAVQFRYFFGGADLVRLAPKLTYAQYAREGFFQLVWVAALVVAMLLAAEWLMAKTNAKQVRTFRVLATLMIAMTGVILVSAYRRMSLYVDEFGLTELRLYTTAFMFWIAALLVLFVATVIATHRDRFFFGALATGLITVVVLHAIDPDDLIVRTNGRRPLDMHYASSLSADAVPALVAVFANVPALQQPCVAKQLLARSEPHNDPREWNLSRMRATAAVRPIRAQLEAEAARCVASSRD